MPEGPVVGVLVDSEGVPAVPLELDEPGPDVGEEVVEVDCPATQHGTITKVKKRVSLMMK